MPTPYPNTLEWTQYDIDEWGMKAQKAQAFDRPDAPVVIPADKLLALLEMVQMREGIRR